MAPVPQKQALTCTKAELDNSSGSLRMNAVNASMNGIISNGSGSLTAGNITVGTTAAAASDYQCIISNASGHMETGDVTVSGSLNLSTASGPAALGQVSAAAYTVSTASGSLKLTGLSGNGSLSCASGSIKAGTLIPTGPVSMDNGSGSIRASIQENTGLEFYAAHIGPGSINAFSRYRIKIRLRTISGPIRKRALLSDYRKHTNRIDYTEQK